MNDDLHQGSDRLARRLLTWPADTPHRYTKLIADDIGIYDMVDFVHRAIRGNASRRRAHRVLDAWVRGTGKVVKMIDINAALLEEVGILRKEVEHLKTQNVERRYWEMQERYPGLEGVNRMSKEDLERLPKDLTKMKKEAKDD